MLLTVGDRRRSLPSVQRIVDMTVQLGCAVSSFIVHKLKDLKNFTEGENPPSQQAPILTSFHAPVNYRDHRPPFS